MQSGDEIYFYKNQYLHKGIYVTSVWKPINQFEEIGEFYLIFPISYTTSENETIMLNPGQCCAELIHHSKLDNGIRLINNIK